MLTLIRLGFLEAGKTGGGGGPWQISINQMVPDVDLQDCYISLFTKIFLFYFILINYAISSKLLIWILRAAGEISLGVGIVLSASPFSLSPHLLCNALAVIFELALLVLFKKQKKKLIKYNQW